MTNEDAINTLNEMWERLFAEMRGWIFEDLKKEGKLDTFKEAHNMAIKSLEQEPILDKIKGYVDHIRNTGMGKKKSLEFIEKFIEGLMADRK